MINKQHKERDWNMSNSNGGYDIRQETINARYRTNPREQDRRERSRSRSPPSRLNDDEEIVRVRLQAERRARMARLRAENDVEEENISSLEGTGDESKKARKKLKSREDSLQVEAEELEGLEEDEQMQLLLGFGGEFGSTKGNKVEDNHSSSARGAAAKHKARKYRQYMNRKNGFNRPLDKMD